MSEPRSIVYKKNGYTYEKKDSFFSKYIQSNNREIYSTDQQEESSEIYYINNDIEYIMIKNMEFKKNTKIVIPNETTLILNNCLFKQKNLEIEGGNIRITNPILVSSSHMNHLTLTNTNQVELLLEKGKRKSIRIKGTTNNFSLDGRKGLDLIESLSIKSINTNITNLIKREAFKIDTQNLTLKDCELDIENKEKLKTKRLNLQNSIIYSNKSDIIADEINLIDSIISLDWCLKEEGIITNKLTLKRSKIKATDNLNINTNNIDIDTESKLIAENMIKIQNHTYINGEEDIEIGITELNRRKLILILQNLKKELETKNKKKVLHL